MTAASRSSSPARPVLALVPPPAPPAPSRIERARSWWWEARGEATFRLRYRILARVADRVATRWQRERAWVAGFEFGFGARDREPFWASLLGEYDDGNEAGIAASLPIRTSRGSLREEECIKRHTLLTRTAAYALPASRASLAREAARQDHKLDSILAVMTAIAGQAQSARPGPLAPLVPVDPSNWTDGA